MGGEMGRNQMLQNIFGEHFDEDEEEEEVDSDHEAAAEHSKYPSGNIRASIPVTMPKNRRNNQMNAMESWIKSRNTQQSRMNDLMVQRSQLPPKPPAASSDPESSPNPEGENDAIHGSESEMDMNEEGEREADEGSEAEVQDKFTEHEESEGERAQSSQEREMSDLRAETEGKDEESESEEHGYGQRAKTSRRREVVASDSERSEDNNSVGNEDEEVDQAVKPREKDHDVRDILGDSDEDEMDEYESQHEVKRNSRRSPDEDDDSEEKDIRPEDIVPDEDDRYRSDDENLEHKIKDKPAGPPLEMEIPLQPPPGRPEKMNMIKVSNIMGIDPKPFDPKTYVEEDVFVTDESGTKKRIRLEDNIVRWRNVRNRDGSTSCESNARFVRWSDGSLQLLIGNEVLDITVQGSDHDHTHLFLRHGKGILQSQGRLLQKMRFMPSSLSSKSHRLLTALVDSRHKKVYKVKNCITDIDPEREKEEREKAESQSIRANELYHRRRERVSRKYAPIVDGGRQLSPGFLEDALEEDEDREEYMEMEAQAERRIMSAKKNLVSRRAPSSSARSGRRAAEYSESEREESEYESENAEESEEAGSGEEAEEEEAAAQSEEEEEEEEPRRTREGRSKRKGFDSDSDSPARKVGSHRRKAFVYDSDDD